MRFPNIFRWLRRLIWVFIFASAAVVAIAVLQPNRQDLPWTPLVLNEPMGMFTGRKVASLTGDRDTCLALLNTSGLTFDPMEPIGADECRVEDGVKLASGQDMLSLNPGTVAPSCPVMIGLLLWQTQVLQPAAQEMFGASVTRIENLGSYSCRRMYGRTSGAWSEHATADAIDISGFVLSDGRRISVLADWSGDDDAALFLRRTRDGACDLFSTVLSPDYNAAHRDHLHIDLADRGDMGWRACR